MATPVAPGATIIAVPTGSPPNNVKQVAAAAQNGPPGAVFHPVQPHMLHWDCHHPGGRVVPLRQPVPPVYYNLPPSHNSSGLQSPNSSEGVAGGHVVQYRAVLCREWEYIRVQQHIWGPGGRQSGFSTTLSQPWPQISANASCDGPASQTHSG